MIRIIITSITKLSPITASCQLECAECEVRARVEYAFAGECARMCVCDARSCLDWSAAVCTLHAGSSAHLRYTQRELKKRQHFSYWSIDDTYWSTDRRCIARRSDETKSLSYKITLLYHHTTWIPKWHHFLASANHVKVCRSRWFDKLNSTCPNFCIRYRLCFFTFVLIGLIKFIKIALPKFKPSNLIILCQAIGCRWMTYSTKQLVTELTNTCPVNYYRPPQVDVESTIVFWSNSTTYKILPLPENKTH